MRLLLNDGVTELSIEAAKRTARLSELSRRVLNAAAQLSAQKNDGCAGLEHLLLVLARERRSPASQILHQCRLDQQALEKAIDRLKPNVDQSAQTLLEEVIDHAVDRADQLGMHYTGTDHMLLALAEHPRGVALLKNYKVNAKQIIATIYRDVIPPPPNQ